MGEKQVELTEIYHSILKSMHTVIWSTHMKKSFLLLASTAFLFITGCSSKTYFGAADINSEPEGADIINIRDNTNLGRTPAQVMWSGKGSEKVTIQLHKNGYHSSITSFWVNKRHESEEAARANATDVYKELEKE